MTSYSLTHLSDQVLLRDLATIVARDRATTAAMLAHLAEVDVRKLYLPAACPSMYAYCVHELRLSEDAAYKRIQAARTARQFPRIFEAVAEGRMHLSGVCLLAPYLTSGNAAELLVAAMDKTKAEIEALLAAHFPRSEMLGMVHAIPVTQAMGNGLLAPGQVEAHPQGCARGVTDQLAPGQVDSSAPGRTDPPAPRTKVAPLAQERFALQVTIGQATYDKLQYIQTLLSHQIPSGDVAEVLDRSFDLAIRHLESRKFAATRKPQSGSSSSPSPSPSLSAKRRAPTGRYIPANVKRGVWERDGGQCTFMSETGRRCPARAFLEFDHVDPVARGGQATVERMRLRCRAHNQYEAEREFGTEFMNRKRQEAERARVEARDRAARAAEQAKERDVVPWLRALGVRADEARRAAAHCESIPEASLEERIKAALAFLAPVHRRARLSCAAPA